MSEALFIGNMFAGIGAMLLLGAMAYFFYQLARSFKNGADSEEEQTLIEETVADKVLEKVGIDVNKFIAKREVHRSKSFRQVLEEKMINEISPKKEGNKK